jgi:hypothetical protein
MPTTLAELTEAEFKALIADRQTMNVGRINEGLGRARIDAADLAALGIDARRDRNATHIRSSDFPGLCQALATHFQQLAQGSGDSPAPQSA